MTLKKLIVGGLIAGAAAVGISAGAAGSAEAKIEPGHYKHQMLMYGFIPTPESNATVVGNRIYQDYYGIGPWNLTNTPIRQTKNGGVTSFGNGGPIEEWFGRNEYRKTRNGYYGTTYSWGVPFGNSMLKKVPPHRR